MIWAAPAEDFVPAFGENAFVALLFGPVGEGIVISELGVAKDSGLDAENTFNGLGVHLDLVVKFIAIIEKCE